MSKSLYKIPFIGREMLLKCFRKKKKNVKFYEKNTTVPFCFVNQELEIYQGNEFKYYTFRKKQMGLKLGEFAKTRTNAKHSGKRLTISKKRPPIKKSYTYDLKSDFFTK
jgi:ribosomal protein S19